MPVKFGVFKRAGADIIPDREESLVNVFAQPRAAPLHLFVENRAAKRAGEHDVFDIRGVKAGGQQIDRYSDARLTAPDRAEIPFELVTVALGAGDSRRVLIVAGDTPHLLRH